jgi:hypothetical protein
MIIDDVNLNTLGVVPADRSPSRSAARVTQLIDGAPGAWRRVRLGRDAPDPLIITLRGAVVAANVSTLQDYIDELKWRLRPNKELTVQWSDTSDREWFGYRESLQIDDIAPGWIQLGVNFFLSIICPLPFAQELSQQSSSSNGTPPRTITPTIGTAPMPVEITIVGNASVLTNPVIHYRDSANDDVYTLAYAGTLSASQTLVIDTELFTAEVNGANVGGNMSGTYFQVDPNDGDYLGSPAAPDIYLTADSGIATTFTVKWFRRYW